ncbi:MAG: orotidine-5'-phosphate decarboxylase [Pseudomonadota bacterium]
MMTKSTSYSNVNNPIICAIDTTDVAKAKNLVREVRGSVGAIKLGLEFFTANGVAGVNDVAGDASLFLDLKFHDIPNTVAGAVRATNGINAFMMTVHTSGGKAMMQAATEAAKSLPNKPLIIGVTVLTSLDGFDLESIGMQNDVKYQASKLAELAQDSGIDGVVCSPHEIEILRRQCGKDFKLIVPGIRPEGSASGDQKRVMTPKEAIEKGADYLVIGRPITEAKNPAQTAKDILASL